MSLADLLPSIRDLSRTEKLRLIQVLAIDLAEAEDPASLEPGKSYPLWSPYEAYEAAAVLLKVLDEGK
jgi:hypothetical protein